MAPAHTASGLNASQIGRSCNWLLSGQHSGCQIDYIEVQSGCRWVASLISKAWNCSKQQMQDVQHFEQEVMLHKHNTATHTRFNSTLPSCSLVKSSTPSVVLERTLLHACHVGLPGSADRLLGSRPCALLLLSRKCTQKTLYQHHKASVSNEKKCC